MSKWPGKYVIGLTGNIATGKSVVRKMLEHLGAYGIDADALAHRAIAKGAPGYRPILDAFGKWILARNGEIDRVRLGRLVFADPEALDQLEAIVHPFVGQAVDVLVQRSSQRVIVIEAIKLLEGKLAGACDTIWTTYAPEGLQKIRLMEKRGMQEADAFQRIRGQAPQEAKVAAANVVIQNLGSFENTWKQVVTAWKDVVPFAEAQPALKKAPAGELTVQRGRPRDSANIAALITRLSEGSRPQDAEDVMAAFGEKAFLLLMVDNRMVGLAGWQVENLVARTTDLYVDQSVPTENAIQVLMTEIESASKDLQCEASLLFLRQELASQEALWKKIGYERRSVQGLGVPAWKEAANESMQPNSTLLFKQLRVDRILRPI